MVNLSIHEAYSDCLVFKPIVNAVFRFTWWYSGRWSHESQDATLDREVEMA
jgi:hypothetical protein